MALSSSRGTINKRDDDKLYEQEFVKEGTLPSSVPVNPTLTETLLDQSYIRNSSDSRMDVDPDSKLLAGITAYISGAPLRVTYYHRLNGDAQERSNDTVFSETLDDVHYSFLKINNFEFKLKDSMSMSFDEEIVTTNYEGGGICYPYFQPQIGDMFIYAMHNHTRGLFRVTAVPNRLSIRSLTCHEITFTYVGTVTERIFAKLENCTDQEAYFKLDRFLLNNGALLESDEAKIISEAKTTKEMLTRNYVSEFLDTQTFGTFICDETLYDPYLVEFIMKTWDSKDMPVRPMQLKSSPVHFDISIWSHLLNPKALPRELMLERCTWTRELVTYRSTRITALANHDYIELVKGGSHLYPPFVLPSEYNKYDTTLPMQLLYYLKFQKIRPRVLLGIANSVVGMQRKSKFYFVPILVFLLKKLIVALETGGTSVEIETKDVLKPIETEPVCKTCPFNCKNRLVSTVNFCGATPLYTDTTCLPPCGMP